MEDVTSSFGRIAIHDEKPGDTVEIFVYSHGEIEPFRIRLYRKVLLHYAQDFLKAGLRE